MTGHRGDSAVGSPAGVEGHAVTRRADRLDQVEYRWTAGGRYGPGFKPVAWSFRAVADCEELCQTVRHVVRQPRGTADAPAASIVYRVTEQRALLLLRRRDPALAEGSGQGDRASLVTRVLVGPPELLAPSTVRWLVRGWAAVLPGGPPGRIGADGLPELTSSDLDQIRHYAEGADAHDGTIDRGSGDLRVPLVAAVLTKPRERLWVVPPVPVLREGGEAGLLGSLLADTLAVAEPLLGPGRRFAEGGGWGCSFSTYEELKDTDPQELPRIVCCAGVQGPSSYDYSGQWLDLATGEASTSAVGAARLSLARGLIRVLDDRGPEELEHHLRETATGSTTWEECLHRLAVHLHLDEPAPPVIRPVVAAQRKQESVTVGSCVGNIRRPSPDESAPRTVPAPVAPDGKTARTGSVDPWGVPVPLMIESLLHLLPRRKEYRDLVGWMVSKYVRDDVVPRLHLEAVLCEVFCPRPCTRADLRRLVKWLGRPDTPVAVVAVVIQAGWLDPSPGVLARHYSKRLKLTLLRQMGYRWLHEQKLDLPGAPGVGFYPTTARVENLLRWGACLIVGLLTLPLLLWARGIL